MGTLYQFRLEPNGSVWFPYISLGCRALTGLEPEAILQDVSRFIDLIHPEESDRFQASITHSAATLEPWYWEGRLLLPDGTVKWFKAESRPERLPDDAIVWDGWILDITSYRQTAERLQVTNERIATIIEGTGDAFFALDRDWRFTYANHRTERLLGKPKPELMGQNIWTLFPEAIGSVFYEQYHHAVEQSEPVVFEEYYPPLDVWFEVRAYPVHGELFIYFTDINDRKQLEARVAERTAEIERTTAQLQAILDNAPAVIYVKDPEGRFILVNRQFEQLLHLTQAEIIGRSHHELFPQEVADTFQISDQEVLTENKVVALEEVTSREDGLHTYVSSKFPLLDENGQPYAVCGISTDITERQRAEAQLQATLSLQEALFNGIDYMIMSVDTGGIIRSFNAAAERMTGYRATEVVGQASPALVHDPAELVQRTAELSAKLGIEIEPGLETFFANARRGQRDECEWTLIRKDGSRFPALVTIAALRNEADEITGIVGIAQDITERKQAQETQRKLAALVENSSDFIGIADLEGRAQYLNPAGRRLVGLPREADIKEHTMLDFVPAEYAPTFEREVLATVIETGTWQGESHLHHFETGETMEVEKNLFTVTNPETNELLCFATVTRDIRDRKQAEAELRAAKEELESFFILALDLLCIADTSGHFLRLNRAWEDVLGYSIDELSNAVFLDFVHPDDLESTLAAVSILAEQKTVVSFVNRYRHKDGSYRYIEWRSSPYGDLIYAAARDITERQEAELQLQQQKRELENTLYELRATQGHLVQSEKMSSLGQLVAGIAHEINNPVNFIYGNLVHTREYTENLLEIVGAYQEQYPEPPEDLQEIAEDIDLEFVMTDFPRLLDSMKIGAQRIREIVTSLRTFSRLDEADCKQANVHEGIDSTLLILQNRLKAKSDRPEIAVIKDYGSLSDAECYPSQLNQVFMNILANAIDALEERDEQRTTAEKKENPSQIWITTAEEQPSWLTVRIRDNGPGISETVRDRLFDPFFTTKATGKGTGLGMSISYQIITERHGGKLTCTSELGQGAEFVISIPVHQQAATTD